MGGACLVFGFCYCLVDVFELVFAQRSKFALFRRESVPSSKGLSEEGVLGGKVLRFETKGVGPVFGEEGERFSEWEALGVCWF